MLRLVALTSDVTMPQLFRVCDWASNCYRGFLGQCWQPDDAAAISNIA